MISVERDSYIMNRIFTDTNSSRFVGHFWLEVRNNIKAVRPMVFVDNPSLF